jgi:hypothetical protein
MKDIKSEYKCPRCLGDCLISYEETVECIKCQLEFDKKDLETLEPDQILAVSEKFFFIKIFIRTEMVD